jgi:hypothetical protein
MAGPEKEKMLPAMTEAQLNEIVNKAVAGALQKAGGSASGAPVINVVLDPKALAQAMVQGQKEVGEEAVIVHKEEKSRADRRKAIEKELEQFDNRETSPYLAFSTELCPHNAPTVGGVDFPKYIIKRGGKNGQDVAAKKVVWLTKREYERAVRFAAEKWMEIIELDEVGNPILDQRTNQPRKKRVPYTAFIRLMPTRVTADNKALDDPSELVANLEAELAAYRAGKAPVSVTQEEADKLVAAAQVGIKGAVKEARMAEEEAEQRFAEELRKPSLTGVRR